LRGGSAGGKSRHLRDSFEKRSGSKIHSHHEQQQQLQQDGVEDEAEDKL